MRVCTHIFLRTTYLYMGLCKSFVILGRRMCNVMFIIALLGRYAVVVHCGPNMLLKTDDNDNFM